MYEIMICKFDEYFKYRLFQMRSNNGMETLPFDDDIYEMIDFLNAKKYKYIHNKVSFKNAKRVNKDFFNDYAPLQDIYCLNENYGILYKVSPFDLRVETEKEFIPLGQVISDDKGKTTYFKRITLDRNLGTNIVSIYAHELVHTQVEKNNHIVLDNFFDREFLSIFIELVIGDFCNDIYEHNAFEERLEILKKEFEIYRNNRKDDVARSYLVSSFKAFHLYNIYLNSSTEIKKEILANVERVFKEEINIGIFLNKYEINYDNSKKVKYLIHK